MRKNVLIVAGTDPLLGAGVVADMRVAQTLGLDSILIETAFVDQDSSGVYGFIPCDERIFERRLERVIASGNFSGMKIGMTASPELVERIASALGKSDRLGEFPVVLDPVLSGGNVDGVPLAKGDMAFALRALIPLVTLVTPNAAELAALAASPVPRTVEEAQVAARHLIDIGAKACLLKGGHLEPIGSDWLVEDGLPTVRVHQGQPWKVDIHGTGCHLSTAITSYLIKGHSLFEACTMASAWLHGLVANEAYIYRGPGRAQFDPFRLGEG